MSDQLSEVAVAHDRVVAMMIVLLHELGGNYTFGPNALSLQVQRFRVETEVTEVPGEDEPRVTIYLVDKENGDARVSTGLIH